MDKSLAKGKVGLARNANERIREKRMGAGETYRRIDGGPGQGPNTQRIVAHMCLM